MKNYHGLIRAGELAAILDDPQMIVVDVRHDLGDHALGARKYAQSHIPGAHFLSVESDLAAPRTGRNGRHPLPAPGAIAATLAAIGVDAGKQVIAYDQAQTTYAARLWWTLRWLGHRNVAVLDGGLDAWLRAGLPVSAAVPERRAARFIPTLSEAPVPVETLVGNLEDSAQTLVDARGAERFRGINETLDPVGGHIPGALNRPYTQNLNPDNTFKEADALRQEWSALLTGRPPGQVVDSCRSGVTACNNLLAMEIAGLSGSLLYPGSWSEWCAAPARPIAR